jgi:SNF2 family DNA or RNA helicase
MTEAFPDKKEKVQQVLEIPMSGEQIRYYKEVRDETVAQIQTGDITTEQAHLKIIKLLQICQGFVIDDEKNTHTFNSHKLMALKDMLTGEGDLVDERVIVWCQFRHDIKQIVEMLKKKQVPTLWYHGRMKDADRERVKHAWNKDHRWKVLVSMIQIGVGLNLHAPKCQDRFGNFHKCHIAVYYGFNHSVTQLEQSMDRIYRGNQTETCLYRYLLSRDFGEYCGNESIVIDKNIYNVLQEKLEQATMIKEESMDYVRRLLGMDDDQEKTTKDETTTV